VEFEAFKRAVVGIDPEFYGVDARFVVGAGDGVVGTAGILGKGGLGVD
jgi:hypothetical protein